MLPDAVPVLLGGDAAMLEQICQLGQAEALLNLMDIDRIVRANAYTGATSEYLVLNVRPHVLVVLLVLESA